MTNVLLDTCAILWLASGDRRLTERAKAAIMAAPVVFVLAISGFEIALKHRQGKLELPATPERWLETIVTHHGLTILDLTLADAIRAPLLSDVHQDPCDRFIIAAALRLDIPVITADLRFRDYGVTVIG